MIFNGTMLIFVAQFTRRAAKNDVFKLPRTIMYQIRISRHFDGATVSLAECIKVKAHQ